VVPLKATPRTPIFNLQVSANGTDWILNLNAIAVLKRQLVNFPAKCSPALGQVRDTAITAIVITDAQFDHVNWFINVFA